MAGRVVRPSRDGPLATPGVWVTLHRVGPDGAGPLDSLRTAAAGRFDFTYSRTGSADAVYFVSASYGGIAYFSEPLGDGDVRGDAADVTVFDTTSARVPLTVRGRHLIVSAAAPSGARRVTEAYELSNDTSVTAITTAGGATFAAVVPAAAVEPRIGDGDISPEAARFADGRVLVSAPFAPGLKQLTFSYTLPPAGFPLSVPVVGGAQVLEVLLEEPAADVRGAGLVAVNPVTIGGRTFKRYLAERVPENAVASVVAPPQAFSRQTYLAVVGAVLGAAMLAALVRALLRRGRRRVARAGAPPPAPDRIAGEIAALDAEYERAGEPTPEAAAAYAERRSALKARLTAALEGSST